MMKKGFTLIELLIVIAILSIITIGGVQTLVNLQQSSRLNSAKEKILLMLAQTRHAAIIGKYVPDNTDYDNDGLDDKKGDTVVAAGYGLYLANSSNAKENSVTQFHDTHVLAHKGKWNQGGDISVEKYDLNAEFKRNVLLCMDAATYTILYTPLTATVSILKKNNPKEKIVADAINKGKFSFTIQEGKKCDASNASRTVTVSLTSGLAEE